MNTIEEDYHLLTTDGAVGFYNSCEITEIFLFNKQDKSVSNIYTIAVFEENQQQEEPCRFLGESVRVKDGYSLGIQQCRVSLEDANKRFENLLNRNVWIAQDNCETPYKLNTLSKQFINASESNRINKILKNNFHNGSYIIEFFDEQKNRLDFLLDNKYLKRFNQLCNHIKDQVPIDLSIARDRIGNFIFQFPVTILDINHRAIKELSGIMINFAWHSKFTENPKCLIEVESTFDNSIMGNALVEYNQNNEQEILIGNLDQISSIKIWRYEPRLLIYASRGTYLKCISLELATINPEPRVFQINKCLQKVSISSPDNLKVGGEGTTDYTNYISSNLYDREKKELESSLSFKQYRGGEPNAIEDLRVLIKRNGKHGVYLWDPFTTPTDIFKTLYFSDKANVPLRAIGSNNKDTKTVNDNTGKDVPTIIAEYQKEFENPANNNWNLNLEFRFQHSQYGKSFHDRFLLFPGAKLEKPKVYSLGTSVNSYGKKHHILQEVLYPQPVVDAFIELWEELNHQECIVWKSKK